MNLLKGIKYGLYTLYVYRNVEVILEIRWRILTEIIVELFNFDGDQIFVVYFLNS